VPVTATNVALTTMTQDSYSLSTVYLGDDTDIPGYSAGKFIGIHYRIDSTGNSLRNSRSVQEQGAYVLGSGAGGENVGWLTGAAAP
jgi:hypothetical protein